jgi:hypothetical protein
MIRKVKMKKAVMLITIIVFSVSSFHLVSAKTNLVAEEDIVYIQDDYSWNIDDIDEKKQRMDSIFVAKIISEGTSYQKEDTPFESPYTIYDVKILGNIKGLFEEKHIKIAIHGGFDTNGRLHVHNSTTYNEAINYLPKINDVYLFSIEQLHEILANNEMVYVLDIPDYLIKLKDYNKQQGFLNQSGKTREKILDHYDKERLTLDKMGDSQATVINLSLDDGGGGGSPSGSSFETAIRLYLDNPSLGYITTTQYKYYKFTTNDTYNMIIESIYYSSNLDTTGYLYDSDFNFLEYDNNDGYGLNFSVDNWGRSNTTYYLKMRSTYSNSGYYKIRATKDPNCSCLNDTSLIENANDSVKDSSKELLYNIAFDDSRYESLLLDAIEVWNELGYVDIKEGFPYPTGVKFYLYNDPDLRTTASYSHDPITQDIIYLNRDITDYSDYGPFTDDHIQSLFIHELGHALGIYHMHASNGINQSNVPYAEEETNVMSWYADDELIVLGPCDKNMYYKLWR